MSDENKSSVLGSSPVDRLLLVVGVSLVASLLGIETMSPDVVVEPPPPPMDAGGVDGVRELCEEALRKAQCECVDVGVDGDQ